MRKFWRVLYPIGIYTGITLVVSFGALLIILAATFLWTVNPDLSFMYAALTIYNQNILLITLLSAIITLPIHIWFFRRDRIMRADDRNPWKLGGNCIYLVILGIGACIAGNNLVTLSGIDLFFKGYEEVSDQLFSSPVWLQMIGVGIVIPIVEELTFRALGFRRLRDHMSFFSAAMISALCFGVFHGNVVQGIYAFALGYLMAWVYERYDSFMAPVLLHCAANIASVLLTLTAVGELVYRNSITIWISTIVMIILTAGCIRYIDLTKHEVKQKEENL